MTAGRDPLPTPQPTLWRHPDFVRLWSGQTISEFGSRITRDGLPFAAVMTLGATPAQMGWLAAAASLPTLVFGLIAGVWTDRLPRRPLMIAADIGRALVLFSIPVAAVLGILRIEQLFVVAALAGLLTVFFDVAYRSYLPSLVERGQIVEGNSKLALSSSTAEVLGPGIAGILVQALSAPIAIFFDSLSFLISAASVALIRQAEPVAPAGERQHIAAEIAEGLRTVAGNPLLRTTALAAGTLSLFGGIIGALYTLYAVQVLGMGAALLGLTIALGGAGSLAGSLIAERVVHRLGLGPTFVAMLLLMGLASLMIPLANGPLAVATLFMSLAQLGDLARTVYFINDVSLRQAVTAERLLGRVNASTQLLVGGMAPVGAVAGGMLGEAIGVRQALFIAALGPFVACALMALSPVGRLRHQPALDD